MKNPYPLDDEGIHRIFNQFLEHQRTQVRLIAQLTEYLREAMTYVPDEGQEWYEDAEALIHDMHQRRMDFDNFRFDQKNGHKQEDLSPYDASLQPSKIIDLNEEAALNKIESGFGETMTEEELARHFGEDLPKKHKKGKAINKMTLEEINEWEAKQNNSDDIYKVAARMKNAARFAVQGNLTSQGIMVVNTFAHMVKAFYDFAHTIPDKEVKIRLTELTGSKRNSRPI